MDVLAIALFFWARWLSTLPGAPRWLRFIPHALVFTFVVSLTGVIFGVIQMERSEPGLSHGFGEGFTLLISGVGFGLTCDVLLVLVLARLTWRLRNPPAR